MAQKENNNWCFGYNNGLSFNTTPPHTFGSSIRALGTAATISDSAGNILFYTNGAIVWDRNNNEMPNGHLNVPLTRLPNIDTVAYTASIIPDPGNDNRFYIFSAPPYYNVEEQDGFYYSVVDMTLNGGSGDILPGYNGVLLDTNIGPAMATAGNGECNKWIVIHQLNSNEFHSFHITPAGISPVVISATGYPAPPYIGNNYWNGNNIKISLDDEKLVWCITYNFMQLFDFNVNTGIVDDPLLLDTIAILPPINLSGSSVEFSPDHSKVYFYDDIHPANSFDAIFLTQLDISLPTAADIQNSKMSLGLEVGGFQGNYLEIGPDNKIYVLNYTGLYNTVYMSIVDRPNEKGLACNVIPKAITLDSNYANNWWNIFVPGDGLCSRIPGNKASFSYNVQTCNLPHQLSSVIASADYIWNTGATSQSINVEQPGTYWVKAQTCPGAWRVDTFYVMYQPRIAVQDTFSCTGTASVKLDTTGYYQWSNNTTGPVFSTTQSGTYAVNANIAGCTYNDTFRVIIYPPLGTAILPADTFVCNNTMRADISSRFDLGTYLWSTGGTSQFIRVDTPGSYWLSSATQCGDYADTVHVTFCEPVIDKVTTSSGTLCNGQCLTFVQQSHNYPQIYQWTFTGGTPDTYEGPNPSAICYNVPGTYTVKLTAASAGGADTDTLQVTVLPKPVSSFTDTSIIVPYNTTLVLPSCGAAANIQWYLNDSLVCENCTDYTLDAMYYLSAYKCVISNGDCSDSCNYKITVTDIPHDAWLPTAFTPNGDGLNDYFHVITNNPNIEVFGLAVYDRWGTCIFDGLGSSKWNGTSHGMPVQLGTYFWTLQYKVAGSNMIYHKTGNVVVVR